MVNSKKIVVLMGLKEYCYLKILTGLGALGKHHITIR